jgi:hypothetical protein
VGVFDGPAVLFPVIVDSLVSKGHGRWVDIVEKDGVEVAVVQVFGAEGRS